MFYVWMTLLALFTGVCLCVTLIGLPGTWLVLGVFALVDWLTAPDLLSSPSYWLAFGLCVLGEIVEFFASSQGAKRAGASRRGARAAMLGGIAGAVVGGLLLPIPLVGSLIGATGGAFAAATAVEHEQGQDLQQAAKAGGGAAAGQVTGMFLKFSIGIAVWLFLTVASFV